MPTRLPLEQHLAVLGDLVLPLLGGDQTVGIDVFQADEHAGNAARRDFSMKFGILWHSVSTWIMKRTSMPSSSRNLMMPVVDRFPVLVAGEIVVGDEEPLHALRPVHAQDLLDVVGRAVAGLAALHIDDGAERALEGAAASGIEARHVADGALDEIDGKERRRGNVADARQLLHVIVEGTKLAPRRIEQHLVEAFFGLAGEDGDAKLLRDLDVGLRVFAAWRGSRRHGSRRSSPARRPRVRDARCRGRGEIHSTARRSGRRGQSRHSARSLGDVARAHLVLVSSMAMTSIGRSGPSTCRSAAPRARL